MGTRLKSLELHGYKTFATQTLFEFSGEITAIVGPNGSGKSNIADSIRWVLGEQSFSLLRGRKTEDMIFAGSEQRARAGMASCTIVFDNEDGWLPIDYAEVSITRRAYRDGQNEYLLNGQKVRLKEISELLGQSGLSERTYTIIGQGLVDLALSLKPDERRRFFEEAAGIGLYRHRREESISRLDTTRRNLERLQDIHAEIEPRLISLEKQARKVQEYERIKADLQLLLRDWYGYHWHRNQKDLQHSQEVYRVQSSKLEQLRHRQSEVEKDLESIRKSIHGLRENLNEWHNNQSSLQHQREKISRDLAVMEERFLAINQQLLSLNHDLTKRQDEQKIYQERIQSVGAEKERLTADLKEAQDQVKKCNEILEQRQAERADVEKKLREIRRALVSIETLQVQKKAHRDELTARLEPLRTSIQSIAVSITDETKNVQKAIAEYDILAKDLDGINQEYFQLESDIALQHKMIVDLETTNQEIQKERSQLEVEKSRLIAQIKVLEQAEKSLTGLNQGARYILDAVRNGKIQGDIKPISHIMDVPEEYETAIAAVLGEFLDGMIIEDEVKIDNFLQLLEQGEKGRTVFLPQGLSEFESKPVVEKDSEVVGWACDLIKVPQKLEALVRTLLGNVLVVKNRIAAREIFAKNSNIRKVVTLKGELFYSNGVVIGGKDGREGVIARPRQKREMMDALSGLDTNISIIEQRLVEIQEQINRAKDAEKDKQRYLHDCGQKKNHTTNLLQQVNLNKEKAEQRLDWHRKQQTLIEKQITSSEEEIKKILISVEEIEEDITYHNQEIRQLNRKLSSLPLEDLQKDLTHWNTQMAVTSRAIQSLDQRIKEYRDEEGKALALQNQLISRVAETEQIIANLEKDKQACRDIEKKLNEDIESLQIRIIPAEDELKRLEAAYTNQQANFASAQQAVSVADRNVTQVQVELSRYREVANSLRRRIEEDFGLVAFEYAPEVAGPTPLPLEGMVEQLPVIKEISPEIEDSINRYKGQLRRLGPINLEAQKEYKDVLDRFEFMKKQMEDLKKADFDLRQVIAELDELMKREFRITFDAVAAEFKQMFTALFGGGSARLVLTDEDNPTETGIDIETRLPGKREQGLALLSGGERSLTAVALVFSLLKVSPTPFCVMDEVDAMLDESNVGRFCDLLQDLSKKTQFIVVTHNRSTVQAAGVIYGVTMGRDSTSQVISLRLDEVDEIVE